MPGIVDTGQYQQSGVAVVDTDSCDQLRNSHQHHAHGSDRKCPSMTNGQIAILKNELQNKLHNCTTSSPRERSDPGLDESPVQRYRDTFWPHTSPLRDPGTIMEPVENSSASVDSVHIHGLKENGPTCSLDRPPPPAVHTSAAEFPNSDINDTSHRGLLDAPKTATGRSEFSDSFERPPSSTHRMGPFHRSSLSQQRNAFPDQFGIILPNSYHLVTRPRSLSLVWSDYVRHSFRHLLSDRRQVKNSNTDKLEYSRAASAVGLTTGSNILFNNLYVGRLTRSPFLCTSGFQPFGLKKDEPPPSEDPEPSPTVEDQR